MAGSSRQLAVIEKTLENGFLELEALFHPGLSELSDGVFPAEKALAHKVANTLAEVALYELHRSALPEQLEVGERVVSVAPVLRTSAWRDPVSLPFHVIEWRHSETAWVAYLPALGIEVVSPDRETLRRRVPEHIQSALLRGGHRRSLGRLLPLARWQGVTLRRTSFAWQPRSPADLEKGRSEEAADREAVLQEVATRLKPTREAEAYEVDHHVEQLARVLTGAEARSALLVGPSGVGKTAVFRECVRRKVQLGLSGYQVWMTTGSRLVAGMSGFGMWQERCLKMCRALEKPASMLHVGHLFELIQAGRSEYISQGIASFLRPYIERRDILVVAECTPEQRSLIEAAEPRILDAFAEVRIAEPDSATVRRILDRWVAAAERRRRPQLTGEAVDAVDRLHRRFGGYSVAPGRALRFVRNLVETPHLEAALGPDRVFSEFARETGLPAALIDETIPMDPVEVGGWFRERLVGQPSAVELVVDILATVKARLARPHKPIASLLFIGPTGVGKTQMAKCLAEFLFGDAHRLVRFDMSEFADEIAVKRLVGDVRGDEGLLTSRVREQPFSVVLFDEFEKADPLFYDLLLQVLGEGRLTDGAGRVADFTNSVVIMTSNLGARAYARVAPGFNPGAEPADTATRHFVRALQDFVRPELFNRIDVVVPFLPLDAGAIRAVAQRELDLTRKREGVLGRRLSLIMDDAVVEWLAQRGFDNQYGARPLKRVLHEEFLVPLAEGLNAYDGRLLLEARAVCGDDRIRITVRPRMDDSGRPIPAGAAGGALEEVVQILTGLRRDVARLRACSAYADASNRVYRFRQASARKPLRRPPASDGRFTVAAIERLLVETGEFEQRVSAAEDAAILSLTGHGPSPQVAPDQLREQWSDLLLRYLDLRMAQRTDLLCLGLFSRHPDLLRELGLAYEGLARSRSWSVRFLGVQSAGPATTGGRALRTVRLPSLDRLLALNAGIGWVMELSGRMVHPSLASEAGRHVFIRQVDNKRTVRDCLVHVATSPLEHYRPPEGVESPQVGKTSPVCRTYDAVQRQVKDKDLGRMSWLDEHLLGTLEQLLDRRRRQALNALLDE